MGISSDEQKLIKNTNGHIFLPKRGTKSANFEATKSSEEFVARHVGGFNRHGLLVDRFHLLLRTTAFAQYKYFKGKLSLFYDCPFYFSEFLSIW